MNKNVDIDKLFPIDPDITDYEIEQALDRPNHGRRYAVAGGLVASIAIVEALRRFRATNGFEADR